MAWTGGFLTKSEYARAHADEVAIAASRGLITVNCGEAMGRQWFITVEGLKMLMEAFDEAD